MGNLLGSQPGCDMDQQRKTYEERMKSFLQQHEHEMKGKCSIVPILI